MRFQAWSLTKAGFAARLRPANGKSDSAFVLMPRPTNLRAQKAASFVGLATGQDGASGTYALTESGIVSFMQASGRDFDKVLDLKVRSPILRHLRLLILAIFL